VAVTKWDEYLVHQTYDTIDSGEVEVDRVYLGCQLTMVKILDILLPG